MADSRARRPAPREWAWRSSTRISTGCLVVGFTGSIDLFSVTQVRKTLLKDLSNGPYALICDLSGVHSLDPACATVFSTVANHPASRWPATAFLLCGAQAPVAEILGRLQVPHFLRLYADVNEAIDQAVARPPYLREAWGVTPHPEGGKVVWCVLSL